MDSKLKEKLELHKIWLESKGGKRADLRNANLCNSDLSSVNLRKADLRNANFSGAKLRNAKLYGADLRNANLSCADLFAADLRKSDLRNVDLRSANLYTADLSDATIHKEMKVAGLVYQLTNVGAENGTLLIADCGEDWFFHCGFLEENSQVF